MIRMSGVSGTLWNMDDHTLAKHAILRRYLQAWYPILSSSHGRIVYIDGFAGPGEYLGGEKGSPVIAIETAIEHKLGFNSEVMFLFIEEKEQRAENLKRILDSMQIPDNFGYEVVCSKFDETLNSEFDKLDADKANLAPCFAFIDPFGYSDTPFSVVKRIMSFKSCEVLITFMSGFLNRFKNEESSIRHINELFGTTDWQHEILKTGKESGEKAIVELYQKRLSTVAKYVRSFEMKNKFNQPVYRLIFATNEYKGLLKMKESMWKVDNAGQFSYSDTTDSNQSVLFDHEPDYGKLKKLITTNFGGKNVSIRDIEEFVVVKTPFRETHFKKQILSEMERADPPEIEIVKSKAKRRKYTYADGTMIIKFNSRLTNSSQAKGNSQPKPFLQTKDLNSFFK